MPITPVPDQYLSQTLTRMQKQIEELSRAIGKPSDSVRDGNDNVLGLVAGSQYATLAARGQDASLVMGNGAVAVADETGRNLRPLASANFIGPVTGDTTGVHHGDVGTTTEAHNHYGDLHGNAFGFHYGPVGDGTTQNQINALNVFATGFFGNVGIAGQNWTLFGTVVAPSERELKTDLRPYDDAGMLVDNVPAPRWRWRDDTECRDEHEHVGPMIDDLAEHAPWLVRQYEDSEVRGYGDRDLIGVLWAALREERAHTRDLEMRLITLERKIGSQQ
jgi:hypothetical protein